MIMCMWFVAAEVSHFLLIWVGVSVAALWISECGYVFFSQIGAVQLGTYTMCKVR
jgi:hypothetical protein